MHKVLVNRLGGLSLPRKSVVRLTDRPHMTLDVYRGRKTTIQQQPFWIKEEERGDCILDLVIFQAQILSRSRSSVVDNTLYYQSRDHKIHPLLRSLGLDFTPRFLLRMTSLLDRC